MVDPTGMIRQGLVQAATIQHDRGGKRLLAPLGGGVPRLQLLWAQSSYQKEGFGAWVQAELGWDVERVDHPWSGRLWGWVPQGGEVEWEQIRPGVFMCFPIAGWSNAPSPGFRAFRRLSKDEEGLKSSEAAWIYLAMIRIMLRRVAYNSS